MSPSGNPNAIEVSEELLQRTGLILLAILLVFTIIGAFISPLDEHGKPVLLLPEVNAFEEYRRSGNQWIKQMKDLDTQISGVLSNEHAGDLFTQSRQAQQMLQNAVSLAKEIDQVDAPIAATGIQDQFYATIMIYLDTARSTMRWVTAPEEGLNQEIEQKLGQARSERVTLESNKWLTRP
ncbi:hypothetical protein FDZ73_20615 [bacterium]|nr:MAG: hypothetical protein FDZ73_20615 [bacterium]